MNWKLIAIGLALILAIWYVSKSREGFFAGAKTLPVSWSAQNNYPNPSNLAYKWTSCAMTSGSSCSANTDPSKWGSSMNTSNTTTAVLNDDNCSGCDYNQNILFAVQAYDTQSGLTSPWTVTNINFEMEDLVRDIIFQQDSSNPLVAGSVVFYYMIAFEKTISLNIVKQINVVLKRGNDTYVLNDSMILASNNLRVNYSGSFTSSQWSSSAPGALQSGDVLTATVLVGDNTPNGKIHYYGSTTATINAVAPGAPTNVTWTI